MTPLQITPGTLIDERYRVVSRVGSGGMAEVYCADDVQLGRRVAVKLLHERFALDEEFVERFRREASSAASLSHANIVSVYDRGEWGGTYYIAMEYLDGRSLDSIVREEAPLPADHAIELTEQVLRAARFAHRRGVVHRDLKPHNVIVDEEGRVKVTDFGIAQAGASEITQTGSIMGTARYLSPEQAQGLPVSPRSDLYSIGVMLYELLTGTVPFEGESVVAIALRHLSEPPRPPSSLVPSISPSLDAIVLRALAKSPEERFADADEFLAALDGERARLRSDPTSQTAALAPLMLPATTGFSRPPVAPAHPATYTTQSIAPITGTHGHSAAAWWDPATGQHPPGPVVLPPGPPPHRRRPVWPWVVVGLLLAAAAVAVVLLLDRPSHHAAATPLVPSVVRETKTVALGDLEAVGYNVVIDIIPSHAPVGTVVSQRPTAGVARKTGTIITLRVSGGPAAVQVPTVVGRTRASAEHQLHLQNFKVSVSFLPSTAVPKHQVISSTPAPGSRVPPGSTVVLVVSTGPPPVVVPNLVGETQGQATLLLQQDKFVVGTVTKQHSSQPAGTVLAQSPKPGKAPQGSSVDLTVATPLPNVTVPYLLGTDAVTAGAVLAKRGLTPLATTVVRHRNLQYDGEVISQTPKAGTPVRPATAVSILIERYVAPESTGPSGPATGPSGPSTGPSGPTGLTGAT
jgi:serine/threonine-protein kinase